MIPTSNHNRTTIVSVDTTVVYLLIPTSNHNWINAKSFIIALYIFWFLHQTTTRSIFAKYSRCCISFDSYIKPQLIILFAFIAIVVYLLIPTSNHNALMQMAAAFLLYIFWFLHQTTTERSKIKTDLLLYIFWFLHQTTTGSVNTCVAVRCISFDSYIKPQLLIICVLMHKRCISFDSYIKPQPTDLNILIFSA